MAQTQFETSEQTQFGDNQLGDTATTREQTVSPTLVWGVGDSEAKHPKTGSFVEDIYTGDLLYFWRKDVHGLVAPPNASQFQDELEVGCQPERVTIIWQDGYSPGSAQCFERAVLEDMGTNKHIELADSNVSHPRAGRAGFSARVPERTKRDSVCSPGPRLPVEKLTCERLYSVSDANAFLSHPIVDHKEGRVQKAKAIFAARRPDGRIAALATVNSPNARQAFERDRVEITRYASHPTAKPATQTNNTATWLLSNICEWAATEGYDRVQTMAGTDGNEGDIYEAANFEFDGFADSSGEYGREGRTNQIHDSDLRRYVRAVDLDGEKASQPRPRRFDGRVEQNDQTHTLCEYSTETPIDERTPIRFRYVREDVSDHKFTKGDWNDEWPSYSDRVHALVAESELTVTLADLENERRNKRPAAAIGAAVGGELVAVAFVGGRPDGKGVATVREYVCRETPYPDTTAQWVLSRVQRWAALAGFDRFEVPQRVFNGTGARQTVPKGIGIKRLSDGQYSTPL